MIDINMVEVFYDKIRKEFNGQVDVEVLNRDYSGVKLSELLSKSKKNTM